LDVEKAFDRVHHSSLFDVLVANEVDMATVCTLRRMYFDLKGQVSIWRGAESRFFDVQRGVRQGDPLSPLLFNLVLDDAFSEVSPIWKRRGYGTNVGQHILGQRLTHVAFADDQTLLARSWVSMKRMLISLREALGKRGLSLHPTKCQVQTNKESHSQRGQIELTTGFCIEVLQEGQCLDLLGTRLSLQDVTGEEVKNRIASAWKKFWLMKPLLTNTSCSLLKRLALFEKTITSSILWASESWTLRATEIRQLRCTQHAMLRKIVVSRRFEDEPWVDWIQRATHKAKKLARDAGVSDWPYTHYLRKWKWAGHVSRLSCIEWAHRVTFWRDLKWQADMGMFRPLRPSTRRWMKFEHSIQKYCVEQLLGHWQECAKDRNHWRELGPDFALWSARIEFANE
jgi:hypothetical protein